MFKTHQKSRSSASKNDQPYIDPKMHPKCTNDHQASQHPPFQKKNAVCLVCLLPSPTLPRVSVRVRFPRLGVDLLVDHGQLCDLFVAPEVKSPSRVSRQVLHTEGVDPQARRFLQNRILLDPSREDAKSFDARRVVWFGFGSPVGPMGHFSIHLASEKHGPAFRSAGRLSF